MNSLIAKWTDKWKTNRRGIPEERPKNRQDLIYFRDTEAYRANQTNPTVDELELLAKFKENRGKTPHYSNSMNNRDDSSILYDIRNDPYFRSIIEKVPVSKLSKEEREERTEVLQKEQKERDRKQKEENVIERQPDLSIRPQLTFSQLRSRHPRVREYQQNIANGKPEDPLILKYRKEKEDQMNPKDIEIGPMTSEEQIIQGLEQIKEGKKENNSEKKGYGLARLKVAVDDSGYKTGGRVKKTGKALVHKDEFVLPKGVKATKKQKQQVAKIKRSQSCK